MIREKSKLILLLLVAMLFLGIPITAQENEPQVLAFGQPSIVEITPDDPAVFDYSLQEPRGVSFQVLGDAAKPSITVIQDGRIVAAEPNPADEFIASLTTFLAAGDYQIEVNTINGESGTLMLVVQSEVAITPIPLIEGITESNSLTLEEPIAIYTFSALPEPTYLYIDSTLEASGPSVRLLNAENDTLVGQLSAALMGGRFRIPASDSTYRVEVMHSTVASDDTFTICLTTVSANQCGETQVDTPTPTTNICAVRSAAGGPVNIRQSASTTAIVVGSLPLNVDATVLWISPDNSFYNIQVDNINGWAARSVLSETGDCTNVPIITPPTVIEQPTQAPSEPTQTPQPTAIPTTVPTATPSGPCLITLIAPTFVYQIPVEQVDYLQDQVAGGELVPTGRLADNSWWQTNYASSWIHTSTFGETATVSGDCSTLPIITP